MLNHLALILSAVLLLSQGLASESPEALVKSAQSYIEAKDLKGLATLFAPLPEGEQRVPRETQAKAFMSAHLLIGGLKKIQATYPGEDVLKALGKSGTLLRMAASNAELPLLLEKGKAEQDAKGNWIYSYPATVTGQSRPRKLRMEKVGEAWFIRIPTPPDVSLASKMMEGMFKATHYYLKHLEQSLASTSDLASLSSALEPHSMKAREIMKGES